jgi:gluconate 2-dehydrogenase subunit 3-like protein
MDEDKKKIDEEKPGAGLTRREWLVSLGSAVVLSGFPVAPGQAQQDPHAAGAALPPGIYQPSFEHLAHALGSEDPFLPIPLGTQTEYLRPRSGPFVPQALTQEEFRIVRRLVEIILGEDLKNSSEKRAAGAPANVYDEVAEWIDLVVASAPGIRKLARSLPADQRALTVAYLGSEEPVRHLETFESERVCHEGLAWLLEESRRRFAKSFLDSDLATQVELVRAISDVRPDESSIHAGTRLFDFLKAECIRGFYTSRIGLKELDYKGNSFYAEAPGCGLTPSSQSPANKPE